MAAVTAVKARSLDPTKSHRLASAVLARERTLPVTPVIAELVGAGGIQRGSTVIVPPGAPGSTTLALELLAGASTAGHWCAAVGLANLGILAARERGIVLDRLLLVPSPGPAGRWQQVLASLFDGVDAVLFAPSAPVRQGDARKLTARARDRGSLLVVLDRRGWWSEPGDLRLGVTASAWSGLGGGHGLLSSRSVEVEVSGRGAAARPRRTAMHLTELSA